MNLSISLSLGSTRAGSGGGAPVIGGLSATTFAETPTYQYHINSATITTLGGNATVTASISGNTLTVTAHSGDPITVGMVLGGGGAPGNQLVRRITALGTGTGGTGTYTLQGEAAANIASSTMTLTGDMTVLSVSERNGGPAMTATAARAPLLLTDALGRKFLRFCYINDPTPAFAEIAVSGVDTHNMGCVSVLKSHGGKVGSVVQVGNSTGHTALGLISAVNSNSAAAGATPVINTLSFVRDVSPPANLNRLFVGASLCVLSSAVATADGVGGATASSPGIVRVNEQSATRTANVTRRISQTLLRIGINNANGGATLMDLYELSLFTTGQWSSANYATRSETAQNTCMSNWGVVPFTRRIVVYGDSRTEESTGGGYNLPLFLTDEGRIGAVPKSTQVVSIAFSGGTSQTMWRGYSESFSVLRSANRISSTDRLIYWNGINDINTSLAVWPDLNTAASTVARANEVYDTGAALDCAFTATVSGATVTIVSVTSGRIFPNSVLKIPGAAEGHVPQSGVPTAGLNTPGATFTLAGQPNYNIPTAVSCTAEWRGARQVLAAALAEGYEVAAAVHVGQLNAAHDQLRSLFRTNLITDLQAGPGQTYEGKVKLVDLPLITVGGVAPFGANYNASPYFRDSGTHPSDIGRLTLFTGGDTPANAYSQLAT